MSKVDKEWRSVRIAANLLYRYIPKINLREAHNSFFDIFATIQGDNLSFGIEVASSVFLRTEGYQRYIKRFYENGFPNTLRLPVIIMCVNETKEEATFGFIVTWDFHTPTVYRNPSLYKFNERTAKNLIDNIAAMSEITRALSLESLSVRKNVSITYEDANRRLHDAIAIYIRDFSLNYRMAKPVINDKKEEFNRYLYGIPEEEYPKDLLDKIIIDALKIRYPNVKTKSSALITNVELGDLRRDISNGFATCIIIVKPKIDLSQFGKFANLISTFNIPMHIYSNNPKDKIIWEGSSIEMTYELEEWGNIKLELDKLHDSIHVPESIAL